MGREQRGRRGAVAVLLVGFALWGEAVGAVQILSPCDRVSVSGDTVILIGTGASGSRVPWENLADGGRTRGEAKALSSGRFGGAVRLSPGRNRLQVAGQTLEVFSTRGGAVPPAGFRPLRVHGGDISNCQNCHTGGLEVRGGGYPAVCLECHVVEAENPQYQGAPADDRHFASAGSKCGRCHDPHGAPDPKLLLGSSQELCGGCHGQGETDGEVHPAYEEGGCVACHAPHFSGYDNQLADTLSGVCGACHEQGGGTHAPVADKASCGACHDPHGAGGTMTPVGAPELCVRCHGEVLEFGHGDELAECLGCHDPHGAGGSVLASVSEICAECHEGIADAQTVHPALEEGCESCHAPHRDDNLARARAGCGDCHDLAGDPELGSLHGGLELSPGSCSGCHPAHAAPGEHLLLGRPHFPLTQGKCSACHTPGEGFAAVDAGRCRACHGFEREITDAGGALHDPVAEGECAVCHEPHMGGAGLLRGDQGQVCGECHEVPGAADGQTRHSAAETCTDCHDPHGGTAGSFLTAVGDELCLACHDDPADAGGEVHPALEEGCGSCHSPHAGFAPAALLLAPPALCLECHDDPGGSGPHREGDPGADCSTCHDPHQSRHRALLRSGDWAARDTGGPGDGTAVQ